MARTGGGEWDYDPLIAVLAKNWWAVAIRGIVGILFGLIALFLPGATMLSLVLIFAAYVIVDGVFGIIAAVRAAGEHERWGLLVFEGVVDIAAGVIAIIWPNITVVLFVVLVAIWALLTGGLMLWAAFSLDIESGRGWLVFGGIVSLVYGVLLIGAPMIGALVLTWWLGAYALVFGIALLITAFKLKSRLDRYSHA
jgi:uncharacterized membrane protein HdeD (DUF308 family)